MRYKQLRTSQLQDDRDIRPDQPERPVGDGRCVWRTAPCFLSCHSSDITGLQADPATLRLLQQRGASAADGGGGGGGGGAEADGPQDGRLPNHVYASDPSEDAPELPADPGKGPGHGQRRARGEADMVEPEHGTASASALTAAGSGGKACCVMV
jgi:hypothetical protein